MISVAGQGHPPYCGRMGRLRRNCPEAHKNSGHPQHFEPSERLGRLGFLGKEVQFLGVAVRELGWMAPESLPKCHARTSDTGASRWSSPGHPSLTLFDRRTGRVGFSQRRALRTQDGRSRPRPSSLSKYIPKNYLLTNTGVAVNNTDRGSLNVSVERCQVTRWASE